MSTVKEVAPFLIDMQNYANYISSKLLDESCSLPPGAENFCSIFLFLVPPQDFEELDNSDEYDF